MTCVHILTSKVQLPKLFENNKEQDDIVASCYFRNCNLTFNLFFKYLPV